MGDAEDRDTKVTAGDSNADEYLLRRWSRRKTAWRKGEAVADLPPVSTAAGTPQQGAAPVVDKDTRQELTDADMPPIDSLDGDSDFSVFMSPKVSEQLRTQALRKLFHLPAFNVADGLNDYDEDYTQFAGLGDVVTQEMKRLLRRELEAEDVPEEEAGPVAQQEAPVFPADGATEDLEDRGEDRDDDPGG
jgi:hypothetical protein